MGPEHPYTNLSFVNKTKQSKSFSNSCSTAVSQIHLYAPLWSYHNTQEQRGRTLSSGSNAIEHMANPLRNPPNPMMGMNSFPCTRTIATPGKSNPGSDEAVLVHSSIHDHTSDQYTTDETDCSCSMAIAQSTELVASPLQAQVYPVLSSLLEDQQIEKLLVIARAYYQGVFEKPDWKRQMRPNNWMTTVDQPRRKGDLLSQFYGDMSDGYSFLLVSMFDKAFERLDHAFGLLRVLVQEQYLQFLTYICDLMTGFRGAKWEYLLSRFFHFLLEMSRTLLPDHHPFIQMARILLANPRARVAASELLLRSILDLLQKAVGYLHADTIGVHQTLAWALLNRGYYVEARDNFQQLAEYQQALHGPDSQETCHALRGLAETSLRQGHLNEAEHLLQHIMDRTTLLPSRQQAAMQYRCMRLLSRVQQRCRKCSQAEHTVNTAIDKAIEAFGDESGQLLRAQMDQNDLEMTNQDMSAKLGYNANRLVDVDEENDLIGWRPEAALPEEQALPVVPEMFTDAQSVPVASCQTSSLSYEQQVSSNFKATTPRYRKNSGQLGHIQAHESNTATSKDGLSVQDPLSSQFEFVYIHTPSGRTNANAGLRVRSYVMRKCHKKRQILRRHAKSSHNNFADTSADL